MKTLLKAIKYIHHYFNHTVEVEQEADSIYRCIEYKNNPLRTLQVVQALEKIAEFEMKKKEKECSEFCRAVNTKWVPEAINTYYRKPNYLEQLEINKLHVVNPIFHNRIPNEN